MTARDLLEMFDERVIDGRAAEGADDGKGLRGDFLGNHHSEARRDLGDELEKDRSAFLDDAAFGDEAGGFRDRLSTGTGSEIMQRIAVPMIGGMVSSTLLTLVVIPAIFGLVKGFGLPEGVARRRDNPRLSLRVPR
jgi:hypothetical protein